MQVENGIVVDVVTHWCDKAPLQQTFSAWINARLLKAGAEGTVTGYDRVKQGKQWRIAYDGDGAGLDVVTRLPAPETVELIEPAT